uniref:RRM domain-containing protein n=1 Tax=Arcella intermedia TaxID=1963864 RepID=A0A6B2LF68_9EUKA
MPYDTKRDEIEDLFSKHGQVYSTKLVYDHLGKPRGYGFVEMRPSEAEAAISFLNGKTFGHRQIKVKVSKQSEEVHFSSLQHSDNYYRERDGDRDRDRERDRGDSGAHYNRSSGDSYSRKGDPYYRREGYSRYSSNDKYRNESSSYNKSEGFRGEDGQSEGGRWKRDEFRRAGYDNYDEDRRVNKPRRSLDNPRGNSYGENDGRRYEEPNRRHDEDRRPEDRTIRDNGANSKQTGGGNRHYQDF